MIGTLLAVESSTDLASWLAVPEDAITALPDADAHTLLFEARIAVPVEGRVFLRLRAMETP